MDKLVRKSARQPPTVRSAADANKSIFFSVSDPSSEINGSGPAEEGLLQHSEYDGLNSHRTDEFLGKIAEKFRLARRSRDRAFSQFHLFHEPAWDILLDMFIAHCRGRQLSIIDAALSGNNSQTTSLRFIWKLEKAKLISRQPDPTDKRRKFVFLTEPGLTHMRLALNAIADDLNLSLSWHQVQSGS